MDYYLTMHPDDTATDRLPPGLTIPDARCVEMVHHIYMGEGWGTWSMRPYPSVVWLRCGQVKTILAPEPSREIFRDEGSVVYYPPDMQKRSRFLSSEKTEFVAAVLSCETIAGIEFLRLFDIPYVLPRAISAPLREILERLLSLNPRPEASTSVTEELELHELALRTLRLLLSIAEPHAEFVQVGRAHRMTPVLEYLSENFRQKITIEELARRACLSRPQFHRQFKALTGMTPIAFVTNLRLREVEKLLLHTDLSIAEIAAEVGWNDPFYLSRTFRNAYGISPLLYRKDRTARKSLVL